MIDLLTFLMCTFHHVHSKPIFCPICVKKGGRFSADLWERRKTTYPRLIAINIVRGCNISPMGGILFPDKTKKRVREMDCSPSIDQSDKRPTTWPTVLTASCVTDDSTHRGFWQEENKLPALGWGLFICLRALVGLVCMRLERSSFPIRG